MKRRFVLFITALTLTLFLFGISVNAEGRTDTGAIADADEAYTDGAPEKPAAGEDVSCVSGAENNEGINDMQQTVGDADTGEKSDTGAPIADEKVGDGIFATLCREIGEYSPVIMSALAAIGSVLLAFCYKRGLLPMLKEALGGMLGAVGRLGERVEESENIARSVTEALEHRLKDAEDSLVKIEALTARLAEVQRDGGEVRTVMEKQVELLLTLFMNSSLPEYKKADIRKMIDEMKPSVREGAAEVEA